MRRLRQWAAERLVTATLEWAADYHGSVSRFDYAGAARATKRFGPRVAFWWTVLRVLGCPR